MTDIISTTVLFIFQSVLSYYSGTKLAFLWELTKLLPKILQEFKKYDYLCRCVLRLIETNYIRKDALYSNARDESYTSIKWWTLHIIATILSLQYMGEKDALSREARVFIRSTEMCPYQIRNILILLPLWNYVWVYDHCNRLIYWRL